MLSGILRNPFRTRKLSLENLLRFAVHHLMALVTGNEEGAFTERIAATGAMLEAAQAGQVDAATRLAMQTARTQTKRAFRRWLTGELARIHAGVVSAYGPGSAALMACFPHGRRAFDRCQDVGLGALLRALAENVASHAPAAGSAVARRAQGLVSTWRALWGEQGEKRAEHQSSRYRLRGLRKALEVELYKNVLMLAGHYAEEPERARRFCPEEHLRNRAKRQAKEAATPSAGAAQPASRG